MKRGGGGMALGDVVHPRPHPVLGLLNLYQWVAFVGGHEARHTAQILEIATGSAKRAAADIREDRLESGETDVSTRHDEHQP